MSRPVVIYVGIAVLGLLAAVAEAHLRRTTGPRHRRPPDR